MKVYQMACDYQHIKRYAEIMGYSKDYVQGVQYQAHRQNMPFDTCDIVDNVPVLFRELPSAIRKMFGE